MNMLYLLYYALLSRALRLRQISICSIADLSLGSRAVSRVRRSTGSARNSSVAPCSLPFVQVDASIRKDAHSTDSTPVQLYSACAALLPCAPSSYLLLRLPRRTPLSSFPVELGLRANHPVLRLPSPCSVQYPVMMQR